RVAREDHRPSISSIPITRGFGSIERPRARHMRPRRRRRVYRGCASTRRAATEQRVQLLDRSCASLGRPSATTRALCVASGHAIAYLTRRVAVASPSPSVAPVLIDLNTTGMPAGLTIATDKHGADHCVLVVKGTFDVAPDGRTALAEEQSALVTTD